MKLILNVKDYKELIYDKGLDDAYMYACIDVIQPKSSAKTDIDFALMSVIDKNDLVGISSIDLDLEIYAVIPLPGLFPEYDYSNKGSLLLFNTEFKYKLVKFLKETFDYETPHEAAFNVNTKHGLLQPVFHMFITEEDIYLMSPNLRKKFCAKGWRDYSKVEDHIKKIQKVIRETKA